MPSEYSDHIETAEAAENWVRWSRYYGTRQVRCTATGEAINSLSKVGVGRSKANPVDIFILQIDRIAAAVSRKYAAQDFNEQGEIVVGVDDL
jgi:hypothetical protein